MIKPCSGFAATRGASNGNPGKSAIGLALFLTLSLALLLAAPGGTALAQCTTNGMTVNCDSGGTISASIGGGSGSGGDGYTITVGDGATTSILNATGGGTVISTHDNSVINIQNGASVQGNANTNSGGHYNSGPNVIEANSNNQINIAAGASVKQNGTTTNGEAINVHGYGNTIVNRGEIHSQNGAALWFQDVAVAGNDSQRNQVENYGTISTGKGNGYNVFGSSQGDSGPGLVFDNHGRVEGSLLFGKGNDSLTFGAGSVVTGNVNGGGGTNDLTLDADVAGPAGELYGSVLNFSSITKTGTGSWLIMGEVPVTPNDPHPSEPISGTLKGINSVVVKNGVLSILGAAKEFTGAVDIQGGILDVQAQGINNAASVKVDAGGQLTFTQTNSDSYTGQAITGGGMVIKQGTGTLTMSSKGDNTYTGGTWIREGTLAVDKDSDLGGSSGTIQLGTSTSQGETNGGLQFDASFDLSELRAISLLEGGGTINTNGANIQTTISQVIDGNGGLTKTGDGTLTLSNTSNIYKGITTVSGGTLAIAADGSLGDTTTNSRLVLEDSTTLQLNNTISSNREVTLTGAAAIDTQGNTGTFNNSISGPGALTKEGTGVLELYGNNVYGGGTTIKEGTVAIKNDNGLGRFGPGLTMYDQTTLRLDDDNISSGRDINLSGTATIDTQANTAEFDGQVKGGGTLNKDGSGTLKLYGNNVHTGGTTISEGTLAINNDNSLGASTGRLTMNDGTTLQLDANVNVGQRPVTINAATATINTQSNTGTFEGSITGSGGLDKTGDGTLALYGNNSYTGNTRIKDGTLAIKGQSALGTGQALELWNQTILRLDAAATLNNKQILIGNTTVTPGAPNQVNINTQTFDGTINSAIAEDPTATATTLVKDGTGTLALYGENTYKGGTTINEGTVAIKNDSGLGDAGGALTMEDATTLRLDGTVDSASRAIHLAGTTATINTQANTGTFSGLIDGTGQLIKTGSGVLALYNNANTYQGGTVVAAGTVAIKDDGALGGGGTSTLELQNATTLRMDADVTMAQRPINLTGASATIDTQANIGKVDGKISGVGQLIKRGSGSLELTDVANDYTGGTWIQQGRVIISDDQALGATSGGLKMDGQTALQLNADVTSARAVNLTGGEATIDTRGNKGVFSGVVSGAGSLVIDDQSGAAPSNSRVELTGSNSYSGGTTVKKGTLAINNNNALGSEAGALNLYDQTTLELMASITNSTRPINLNSGTATINTLGNTGTFGGNISGAGGLDKIGPGVLKLLGNSSYQGNTRIKEGTLVINSNNSLGAGPQLELWNQTVLQLAGNTLMDTRQVVIGDNTLPNVTIPNRVTIDTDGFNMQINSNITQAAAANIDTTGGVRLDKTGGGVLALYGNNEHQGGTWVKEGAVAIKNTSGLGYSDLYLGYHSNTTYYGGDYGVGPNPAGNTSGTLRFDGDLGGNEFTSNIFFNEGGGIIDTQGYSIIFSNNTLQDGDDDPLFAFPPYTRAQAPYRTGYGAGPLTKTGSGVMGIDGFQYYSGATNINEGIYRIYSFDIDPNNLGYYIGAVNTSAVTIAAGARLEGQGVIGNMLNDEILANSNSADTTRLDIIGQNGVTKTTVTNSGTIAPGLDQYIWNVNDPLIDVTQFNALTLAGSYTATEGATIEIHTQLIDDTSQHGTLVIQDKVEDNSAVTGVRVTHQGGDGALTTQGIEIIRIVGTDDHVAQGAKFKLVSDFKTRDGRDAVVAGAYAYWMEDDFDYDYQAGAVNQNSTGIYLRNAMKPGGGNVKVVNPNTPLYESYALILGTLNRLPTLEQRVGHRNWVNSPGSVPVVNDAYPVSEGERAIENRGPWIRMEGATGTFKPNLGSDTGNEQSEYELDYGRLNVGLDWPVYVFENGSKLIGGVNANFGQGDAEVKSPNGDGKLKTRNKGLGASLTWYSDGGFYADAQARYNWFDTDIRSHTITSAGNQVSSNDGRGKAFSLEIGQIFDLDEKWSLTPQGQLSWSETTFDSFIDPQYTTVVHEEKFKSLEARLGLAVNYENSYEASPGMVSRNKFYGLVNYYHEFKGESTVSLNKVKHKSQINDNWVGLAVGGTHNWANDQYSIYGELGARSSTEHFGSEREFTGELGVRLAF
ncbi:hypothetical protein C4J81_12130 [Deltaproteobacteria bacterium Smac51]|nr:hypothetical protein C4J81_12130 [Deltaproteobacteria bacterium Smac51]